MNNKHFLLAILATLCASTALASDIYRYVDENGDVIYVDRPTGNPGETRMDVYSRNTDNAAVQARVQTRQDKAIAETESDAEEGEAKLTRGEKRAIAAANQQQCQAYRTQLDSYVASRRLFREDEGGERVYLSDAESQEARDRVQRLIEETCD